jgi:hypothetical protein
VTVVLDDHLVRDWMARRDTALRRAVGRNEVATTNLWYARLCKSAARSTSGALLAVWGDVERRALVSALIALPEEVVVVPMRQLAWKMGELVADHTGLSTLAAEAVAAAIELDARVLVSARDDGLGIRAGCKSNGVRYDALAR